VQKADKNKLGVRIMLGVIVGFLGIGMLLYLVPQGTSDVQTVDVVAQVDDQTVTVADVRGQLGRIERNGALPPAMEPLYAQQVLNQLVFEKELAFEARRLGIAVTDQERSERIRELIPGAFVGDAFVGMEPYAQEVQARMNMTVPDFEALIDQALIEEQFRQLVTDGITVSPDEIQQEFRRRNEKIKIEYVVIKPDDLQSKIEASDADLAAYFDKNKSRYAVPERRIVRYAFLDQEQLRTRVNVTDDEIRAAYNDHLDRYKIEDRAHVAHILFKTVGKTDAEVEEIRKKAEDVLKKAKGGANFADLAKQYSEDTSKDKGGDLDWIVRGQTVPEFEKVAFSLPKGAISDVVKTQYGFHIIKVIDRQTARTQTLDEVRPAIVTALQQDKAQQLADQLSGQMADEIRRSGRVPIDDFAKQFNVTPADTPPLEAGQSIPAVGNAPELSDTVFRVRAGDLSAPIRTDRGYVVLSVKEIQPAHPGTLPEVRDRVLADYRRDKSVELAKSRAADVAKRANTGEDLGKIAKSLDLEAKTSDPLARNGSIPDIGGASVLSAAFALPVGRASDPLFLGANWLVYRVVDHQQANSDDFTKQQKDISDQLLQQKREMAFDAFRSALEAGLRQNGTVRFNDANLKRLTTPSSS
jgi:peptidyl-prolyl cis-trans isomerase D